MVQEESSDAVVSATLPDDAKPAAAGNRSLRLLDEIARLAGHPFARSIALVGFSISVVFALVDGSPLGWDESVYAARAADFADTGFEWGATSGPYWSDVRAPGLPVLLGAVFGILGPSDFVARGVVAVTSLLALVLLGRTCDLVAPPRVGTTAIVLCVLCPGYLATSTLAFADIPSLLFGLVAVYSLLRSYVDRDPRWAAGVAVGLAVATTFRFGGTFLVIGPLIVVAVVISVRLVRERDLRTAVSYVLAAIVAGASVLVLLLSRVLTTDLSPIAATSEFHDDLARPDGNWLVDLRTVLRPGAVDYGFDGPFWALSYALPFAIAGVAAIAMLLIRRQGGLLLAMSLISILPVAMYAITVNQFVTTYLAPIFVSWAVAVAMGLWGLANPPRPSVPSRSISPPRGSQSPLWAPISRIGLRTPADGARVGLLLLVSVLLFFAATGVREMHDRLWGFDELRVAASIGDELLGSSCRLVTTRAPQVTWYSDCSVAGLRYEPPESGELDLADFARDQAGQFAAAPGELVGVVLFDGMPNEPSIDAVLIDAAAESSAVLASPTGRRVAVLGLTSP